MDVSAYHLELLAYARMALYVGGASYCVLSVLYLVYYCRSKRKQSRKPAREKSTSKTLAESRAKLSRATSASKTLPVTVTEPKLSSASVFTQTALENIVPQIMQDTTSGNYEFLAVSPPTTKANKGASKSLKLGEYAGSTVAGKMSFNSIKH